MVIFKITMISCSNQLKTSQLIQPLIRMRSKCLWFLLLLLGISCSPNSNPEESKRIGASVLFTTEVAEDATPAVLSRILSANEKPISELKFEKDISNSSTCLLMLDGNRTGKAKHNLANGGRHWPRH